MANKFKGRWLSEIEIDGKLQRDDEFEVRDGATPDKVIVRKPAPGSASDDTEGTTSGDKIEFTSNGRRYTGEIKIHDDPETPEIEATIKGTYRDLALRSPEGAGGEEQKGYASQSRLRDDDDWVATRPPGQ